MTPTRVVILSWDGMSPEESFSPGMERLQGSPSVLGWNDSREDGPSGTTAGESICPEIEQFGGSHSVVVKRLQGNLSVLGWKDVKGIILSWDRTTPE